MDATAAAAANIFGKSQDAGAKSKEPRTMLTTRDMAATKVFDPWGVSIIDDVPLEQLWSITAKGDKFAKFFSNLGSEMDTPAGKWRVGVGLSQLAEVMDAAIGELKSRTELKQVIKDSVYKKAMDEATELLPVFKILNAGTGSLKGPKEDTFGGLKKKRKLEPASNAETPTPEKVIEATAKFKEWLNKDTNSNLRMLISFLSSGGVFYAAHAADKVTRAWLKHQAGADENMLLCMQARHQPAAGGTASSSGGPVREVATGGLFD